MRPCRMRWLSNTTRSPSRSLQPQLKARIAQQRREAPVRGIERSRIVRGELQRRDGAAVVMHGAHLSAAGQLNQRPFGIQFGILGSVLEGHRRLRSARAKASGAVAPQMLGDGETVAEQALAAVGRGDRAHAAPEIPGTGSR